jgi:hypothetical protein
MPLQQAVKPAAPRVLYSKQYINTANLASVANVDFLYVASYSPLQVLLQTT